jgi:hypothetical protein
MGHQGNSELIVAFSVLCPIQMAVKPSVIVTKVSVIEQAMQINKLWW